MFTDKDINQMKTIVRSSKANKKVIKVVYLGRVQGFRFGEVQEAVARYVGPTNQPFPYPKNQHCHFQIDDEDGDSYTISKDGVTLKEGFYPVPDEYVTGSYLIDRKRDFTK